MTVGIPKETYPGERCVAIVPAIVPFLTKSGLELVIETGAGEEAGYVDSAYSEKGVRIASSRDEVFGSADVILKVRACKPDMDAACADMPRLRQGQVVIGFFDPLSGPARIREMAATGITSFAMELMPRITRAQNMDALSSMATVAGYKAVVLAAEHLPKMFPMLMTAAGTVAPARVFVIGAGVAGLQAIATARRLGGVVHAYDVRPAVKDQVVSVGAKFVELPL
jgi:NAD(P) transhydrogenase subunit alpha